MSKKFFFLKTVHPTSYSMGTGVLPGVKRLTGEVEHSSPASAKILFFHCQQHENVTPEITKCCSRLWAA
jgi:hypothetical protein